MEGNAVRYRVGAFKDGAFERWAGYPYKERKDAEEYCEGCIRTCSYLTGLQYKVVEVEG